MSQLSALKFLIFLAACFIWSCSHQNPYQISLQDDHSFARPEDATVTHMDLDLEVDFERHILSGSVKLHIANKTATRQLVLDTKGLVIESIRRDDGRETAFRLGEFVPFLGQSLTIDITPETEFVLISYRTTPEATALQWLTPGQTAGRQFPFLLTQSQANHARSWIPCQDTPCVRSTYSATVRTDPELMAVMSAENVTEKQNDGVFHFSMPQAIPSYLIALAIGDLAFEPLGKRSGVYAEPSILRKAVVEFEDTERMIAAAENLYGPYSWQRYDILVLPPSFPFGGMENPRLTFVTPTLLAGDKSLVATIAHELAHSWSGNLVTNANWNDFWVNEGFTVYSENRIMAEIYGQDYADMLANLSFQDLQQELQELGPENPDTCLKLNLAGRDPDDGVTSIPYEKGYYFLRTIERVVGKDRWDNFLTRYFRAFAFKSMTTEVFLTYLRNELLRNDPALAEAIKIAEWVYQPGLPDNAIPAASDAFESVDAERFKWQHGMPADKMAAETWTTQHWLHFLRGLKSPLSENRMAELDATFEFTQTGNYEILCEWLLLVISNHYEAAYPTLEDFLAAQGRIKFLEPLYKKMTQTSGMRHMAAQIYQKAKNAYHPLAVAAVDKILLARK